jgi:hypothetical protein
MSAFEMGSRLSKKDFEGSPSNIDSRSRASMIGVNQAKVVSVMSAYVTGAPIATA